MQLPETHHLSQSQSRLSKRSRVSTRLTQNPQLLRRPSCQAYSCLKWLSTSPPPFAKCHDSVNQDHSACARNIGMTFGSLAVNSNLFVQVVARIAAAANSPLSSTIPQGRTDHTTRQTHRWPQTTSHDVLSPQVGTQISNGSKEKSVAKCVGPLQRCWKTRRSKHDDQNHSMPRGS